MANNSDANGVINTGLRADVMRTCMENKNLLENEGSLYVGTGESISFNIGGETVTIPKTEALEKGGNNTVLTATNSGLTYSQITPDMVEQGSTYNITSNTAITCNLATEAGTALKAQAALYPADNHGEPVEGAPIITRFENNDMVIEGLKERIDNIEDLMNFGVDLLDAYYHDFEFQININGTLYTVGTLYFDPNKCKRYYNSCFLTATIEMSEMESDNSNHTALEAFYRYGEVATSVINLAVNNQNFLPKQDVEFYINTDIKLRYDQKIATDPDIGSSVSAWFSAFFGQPLLLKIKKTGEITLQAQGRPSFRKTSGSSYLVFDHFELGKYNSDLGDDAQPIIIPETFPKIQIYYLPKIND